MSATDAAYQMHCTLYQCTVSQLQTGVYTSGEGVLAPLHFGSTAAHVNVCGRWQFNNQELNNQRL